MLQEGIMNQISEQEQLIRSVIHKYHKKYLSLGIEREDLIQIGFEAVLTLPKDSNDLDTFRIINSTIGKYIYNIEKDIEQIDHNIDVYMEGTFIDPANIFETQENNDKIRKDLDKLTRLEQYIIKATILSENPKQLIDIAAEFKVSKQRISEIKKIALDKLKKIYEE